MVTISPPEGEPPKKPLNRILIAIGKWARIYFQGPLAMLVALALVVVFGLVVFGVMTGKIPLFWLQSQLE